MKKIFALSFTLLIYLFQYAGADPTGRVHGFVKDPEGNPIEGVQISIDSQGDRPEHYTAKTNKKGEYIHIAVKSGKYRITPSKEGYVPVQYGYIDAQVTLSDKPFEADFTMQTAEKAAAQQKQQGGGGEQQQDTEQIKAAKAGVDLLKAGKVDEAIASLEKAVTTDPTLATAHYNLGVAYQAKERNDDAVKQYQEAIKVKPDFGEAYLALGNTYLDAKNFDSAAENLAKAASMMPGNYIANYNEGVAYSNSGKYAEAEGAYRKAEEINPKEPIVHYQLGMALLGQSKNADAKAEFQKYLELNPNAADKQEVQDLLATLQ